MDSFHFRVGIIKISKEIFDDEYDTLFILYKDVLPQLIQFDAVHNCYIITAKSRLFDVIEEGKNIPEYLPIFSRINKYNVKISEMKRLT
jgi:hypothetical protein